MRKFHTPINIDGSMYNLAHLNAFLCHFPGKGQTAGTNLTVEIEISCHVYSQRCVHPKVPDLHDSKNNPRSFCALRFALSENLPTVLTVAIAEDRTAIPVKDYNQHSNLIVVEGSRGQKYAVVFCFEPTTSAPNHIVMKVLSAYRQNDNSVAKAKGNKISYYARKCLFKNKRVP